MHDPYCPSTFSLQPNPDSYQAAVHADAGSSGSFRKNQNKNRSTEVKIDLTLKTASVILV
jgi:hypothetical protein